MDKPAENTPKTLQEAPKTSDNPPTGTTLPEAPFSANFRLFDKHGIDVQFTVRAETVSEGVKRVDVTVEALLKSGYTVKRAEAPAVAAPTLSLVQPTTAPVVPPTTTPPTVANDVIRCVELKKIVDEGKTRIEFFDSIGADQPEFTIRIDADFKKLAATGIDVNGLQIGTRYQWPVNIRWTPGKINPKNNKPYRNVTEISKAS